MDGIRIILRIRIFQGNERAGFPPLSRQVDGPGLQEPAVLAEQLDHRPDRAVGRSHADAELPARRDLRSGALEETVDRRIQHRCLRTQEQERVMIAVAGIQEI